MTYRIINPYIIVLYLLIISSTINYSSYDTTRFVLALLPLDISQKAEKRMRDAYMHCVKNVVVDIHRKRIVLFFELERHF